MSPVSVWHAFGRKAAVIAGASTALVSLLAHNTLLTASLRGAIALFTVLLVVRFGTALMARVPVSSAVKAKGAGASKPRNG
jgi:hypothetical protein